MKMQIFTKILVITVVISMTSCVVSKKKYEALLSESKRKQDSLKTVIGKYQKDFEMFNQSALINNSYKIKTIDSLYIVNSKLSRDTLTLQQNLRNTISDYENQKNKLIKLTQEMETKNNEIENLRLSLQNMEKELRDLQEMVEKTRKQNEILLQTIKKALVAFDTTELNVKLKDGKIYVSLEEKLLFKPGSAKIDAKGEDAIKRIAKVLEANPDINVLIEGHTDNVGSSEYNWNLSTQRALSVVYIIEKNAKIDMSRITVAGRGMYSPIESNSTEKGRQKNRRIEIILQPKLDVLYNILQKN